MTTVRVGARDSDGNTHGFHLDPAHFEGFPDLVQAVVATIVEDHPGVSVPIVLLALPGGRGAANA